MEKLTKRKAFNFFRSYYDVFNELETDEDKVAFITALLDRQFLGIKPTELKGMAKFAYISQINSIDTQVKGYEDKTKIKLGDPTTGPTLPPTTGPTQGPTEPPMVIPMVIPMGQGQEKEEDKEKDQENSTSTSVTTPVAADTFLSKLLPDNKNGKNAPKYSDKEFDEIFKNILKVS